MIKVKDMTKTKKERHTRFFFLLTNDRSSSDSSLLDKTRAFRLTGLLVDRFELLFPFDGRVALLFTSFFIDGDEDVLLLLFVERCEVEDNFGLAKLVILIESINTMKQRKSAEDEFQRAFFRFFFSFDKINFNDLGTLNIHTMNKTHERIRYVWICRCV